MSRLERLHRPVQLLSFPMSKLLKTQPPRKGPKCASAIWFAVYHVTSPRSSKEKSPKTPKTVKSKHTPDRSSSTTTSDPSSSPKTTKQPSEMTLDVKQTQIEDETLQPTTPDAPMESEIPMASHRRSHRVALAAVSQETNRSFY